MNFKLATMLYLLVGISLQECGTGCLKCTDNDVCTISNIIKLYKLIDGKAEKADINKCVLIDFEGTCLDCEPGYYNDGPSNKCVAIEEESKIENCVKYSTQSSCSECKSGFFLDGTTCAAVEKLIVNCDIYFSNELCASCDSGHLLSADSKKCVKNPDISNCVAYSPVNCVSCSAGFVRVLNGYLAGLRQINNDSERSALALTVTSWSISSDNLLSQTACETALASNCASFDPGLNVCNACADGYFLTEDEECEIYPEEPVSNCKDYSAVDQCDKCISGHHFKNSECVAISAENKIDNCILYDTSSASIDCLECTASHYLRSNSCSPRDKSKDNSISNCASKNKTADKCGACADNFYLTDDGLECLSVHLNCLSYNSVNKGGTLQCNKCADTYYLKINPEPNSDPKTECLTGIIDNCAQYSDNSNNICESCLNGYVKEGSGCVESNNIFGCTVFNPTDKKACETCTNDSNFNFLIRRKCSLINTRVDNCRVHDTGTLDNPNCQSCNDGYELVDDRCDELSIDNCIAQGGGTICTTCGVGFALSRDSQNCLTPFPFLTGQCKENSTTAASGTNIRDVTCQVCKEHAYPIDFQNQYVCVANTDLTQYADSTTENCIRYDSSLTCLQCDPYASNKYLRTDDTCQSSCDTGPNHTYRKVVVEDSGVVNELQITSFNVCEATTDPNDKILAENLAVQNQANIAIACHSERIPKLAATTSYSNVDPYDNTEFPYMPNPWFKFPELVCTQEISGQTINNETATADLVASSNCDYFYEYDSPDWTCVRCKHGFTGTITNKSGILDYITCSEDNSCDPKPYYNLDTEWNKYYSCHRCKNSSEIPFLAFVATSTGDNNTQFNEWGEWSVNVVITPGIPNTYDFMTNTGSKNIMCLEKDGSSFPDYDPDDYNVADNCAMAAIKINDTAINDLDGGVFSLFCTACKPGYRATPETGTGGGPAVSACTAIPNCDQTENNLVNACEKCKPNFILQYDITSNRIMMSDDNACIDIPTSNKAKFEGCWAAEKEPSSNTARECRLCLKGYTMNQDMVCEQITPTNCKVGYYRVYDYQEITEDADGVPNKDMILYQQHYAPGCSLCESSFTAVAVEDAVTTGDRFYCVASNWIMDYVDPITNDSDTEFIPYCKFYDATDIDTYRCIECDSSHVINESRTQCYSSAALPDCRIASSSNQCSTCTDNTFSLVYNVCLSGNIANCFAYEYEDNNNQVTCSQCSPGFYLTTNNKCEQGLISHCKRFEFNQPNQCAECETGYIVTNVGDGNVYCYPIPDILNCSDMNYNNNDIGGEVTCTACNSPDTHLIVEPVDIENTTICISFISISNCTVYDVGTTLNTSTFKCVVCSEGFYVDPDTNSCLVRENKPKKCTAYHSTKDECTACGSNSYLFNSNKECKDYPTGIPGCSTYSDANTCITCKAKRYLKENACPLADPEIENCSVYSSNTVCSLCQPTYILRNNECKKANALNCATYRSIDACATCGPEDGLETLDNVTSCVNKIKPDCDRVNDNSPYNCELCKDGFYLDNGECKNPTIITNCTAYDSSETCAVCDKGYALSIDKKSCSNENGLADFIPAECKEAKVVSGQVCSRCGAGYWFKEDKCEELCTGDSKNGCFSCDPTTPDKCFVCKNGYFMTKDQKCIKEDKDDDDDKIKPTSTNSSIIGMTILLMTLIVFLK